jgi:probable rRNA maturation factor
VITVDIADRQNALDADRRQIRRAVRGVLDEASIGDATVSVALVDDRAIARLHGRYLADESPTDVMSFVLERGESSLEGEVVASAETAVATAPRYGWTAQAELLLYVIHGALHLIGYGDSTPEERAAMRRQEARHLARFGLSARGDCPDFRGEARENGTVPFAPHNGGKETR